MFFKRMVSRARRSSADRIIAGFLCKRAAVEHAACASDLSAGAGGATSHFDCDLRPCAAGIITAFPLVITCEVVCVGSVRVRNGPRCDNDAIEGRVSGDDLPANLASIHSPQRQESVRLLKARRL